MSFKNEVGLEDKLQARVGDCGMLLHRRRVYRRRLLREDATPRTGDGRSTEHVSAT